MKKNAIPVAMIDDHTLFRTVLADMLNDTPRFDVVLQAANGREYVQAVRTGIQISVAVVDLNMPVMDGYETIAWIRANTPGTRPLVLTYDLAEDAMVRAMRAGACGFLRKDTSKAAFLDALQQVAFVGHYHQPSGEATPEGLRAEREDQRDHVLKQLSERELEFIDLACEEAEHTNDQIADLMQVHRRTLDGFRESVYAKCGVKTRAGLVLFAYKWGLLD
ncbi:MAG: response regulator transcription factor [Flavobacteriales bacterium]|nr:response regulator transcription factor [Flavobacteriales bacterium]